MRRDLEEDVSEFPEKDRELAGLLISDARNEIRRDYEKARSRHYRAFLLHIENNLTNPDLDVNDARSAAGLTGTSTYAIEFFRIVGMNPAPYIEHHRMELARRLLQHTRGKISSVAFAVGYTKSSHFSDRYKKWAGHRPSKEPRADSKVVTVLLAQLQRSAPSRPQDHNLRIPEDMAISAGEDLDMPSLARFWSDIHGLNRVQIHDYCRRHLAALDLRHFHFLLEKSKLEGRKCRVRGEELCLAALDALRAVEFSSCRDFPDEKILCYAHLANHRRLRFDMMGARDAFRLIDEVMPRKPKPTVFLQVSYFRAYLLWYDRRLGSAVKLVEQILPGVRAQGSNELRVRILQLAGELYDCSGQPDRALPFFEEAVTATRFVADPYITLPAHYNLAYFLARSSNAQRASQLFEKVRQLHEEANRADSNIYLVLLDAMINKASGNLRAAESAFLEAREGFRGLGYDILEALTDLELALLYLELGETHCAFSAATAAIPPISRYSAHKEAVAALAILQEASKEGIFHTGIIKQALHHLEFVRKDPTSGSLTQQVG